MPKTTLTALGRFWVTTLALSASLRRSELFRARPSVASAASRRESCTATAPASIEVTTAARLSSSLDLSRMVARVSTIAPYSSSPSFPSGELTHVRAPRSVPASSKVEVADSSARFRKVPSTISALLIAKYLAGIEQYAFPVGGRGFGGGGKMPGSLLHSLPTAPFPPNCPHWACPLLSVKHPSTTMVKRSKRSFLFASDTAAASLL
mmetsp:Transcript_9740/g.17158  ORF Transcript_9740/g.17158 Transcript_9740/m.17158 type:complete len:207 (+) Transcript_9740:416-1036(+)